MLNSIIIGLFSRGVGSLESDIGSGVDALCDNDLFYVTGSWSEASINRFRWNLNKEKDQGVSKWVVSGAAPGVYQWPKTNCPSAGIALKAAWEMTPIRWGCAVPQTGISIFVGPYYSNVGPEKH